MIRLDQGDNRASLRAMIARGEFVDSVVCDPPYGLVSVTKRFGGKNAAPAKHGTDGLFARQSKGFMGKLWDGSGIERDPEFWSLVFQVMKPGAYIIAFSSSRTYGYMQVAMETAGFITHPMFGWVFNTGFPKGHDVGQAVEKTLTTGRARRPDRDRGGLSRDRWSGSEEGTLISDTGGKIEYTTEEGRKWDGWKTGTQSLKPALEPVYFGQKPFSEKTGALNIMRHGVGAVNVDGCRVPGSPEPTRFDPARHSHDGYRMSATGAETAAAAAQKEGRYPANLVHDGSPEVVALFPQSGGQIADVSTAPGVKTGRVYGKMNREGEATADKRYTEDGVTNFAMTPGARREDGGGSAARFFNSFPHEGPIMCYPKAGKADRAGSKHATVKPIALMQHYVRLVTPPGGVVLDPFAGTGTTAEAARREGMTCVLMEAEQEYIRDICRRFDLDPGVRNRFWQLDEAISRLTAEFD